jgi:hypothetical protein
MQVERGWYHAQGDPAGTVRLWNGESWVGFPVPDPKLAAEDKPRVRPFVPVPGQVRLAPLAAAAQLAVVALMAVTLFRMYVAYRVRSYRVAALEGNLFNIDVTQSELTRLTFMQAILWLVAIVLVFVIGGLWMWRAWANLKLWHKPLHRGRAISKYSPLNIMLELQTHSPPKHRAGALNPVWAWGWWALFAGVGAVERAVERRSFSTEQMDETATTLLAARLGLMGLTMVSFVLGIILIRQITQEQDLRMTPTRAQIELAKQEAALKQTLQDDPNVGKVVVEGRSAHPQPVQHAQPVQHVQQPVQHVQHAQPVQHTQPAHQA